MTLPAGTTSYEVELDEHPRRIQLYGHARGGQDRPPRGHLRADERQQRRAVEAAGDRELATAAGADRRIETAATA